jgi:hypothetical protein
LNGLRMSSTSVSCVNPSPTTRRTTSSWSMLASVANKSRTSVQKGNTVPTTSTITVMSQIMTIMLVIM